VQSLSARSAAKSASDKEDPSDSYGSFTPDPNAPKPAGGGKPQGDEPNDPDASTTGAQLAGSAPPANSTAPYATTYMQKQLKPRAGSKKKKGSDQKGMECGPWSKPANPASINYVATRKCKKKTPNGQTETVLQTKQVKKPANYKIPTDASPNSAP
jgi:hypothetical protein